jgi:hypothetical protein
VRNMPQDIIARSSREGVEGSRRDEAAPAALGSEASTHLASTDSDRIVRNSSTPAAADRCTNVEVDDCLEGEAADPTEPERPIAPVANTSERPAVGAPLSSPAPGSVPFIPPRIQASIAATPSPATLASAPAIRRAFKIRNYAELQQRCSELGAADYLLEGILPARSIGLLVGDSGLGKSPLLYQLGISVAAGVPFLGHPVRQGTTLYLDYENGLADSAGIVQRVSGHLGLESPPEAMNIWNFNDCSPSFSTEGHGVMDMIKFLRPTLVIIDSLSAYRPEIEGKSSSVTLAFQELRKAIRDYGVTILAVHHIKKPSTKSGEEPPPLDEGDVKKWFLQTRGSGNLINASDVRLGIDTPGISIGIQNVNSNGSAQAALVLRGFGRVRGEIGPLFIARSYDDEGEPMGYRHMNGVELLFNDDQQEAFSRLPQTFSTGEAKRIYGRQDQATHDFLKKCVTRALLKQTGRGQFEKCRPAE